MFVQLDKLIFADCHQDIQLKRGGERLNLTRSELSGLIWLKQTLISPHIFKFDLTLKANIGTTNYSRLKLFLSGFLHLLL
jgi:hypothetical protein